jgi:hypothetical protein
MALTGNLRWIDAVEAVQAETISDSGCNHLSTHILDDAILDTDVDADREQWDKVVYRKFLRLCALKANHLGNHLLYSTASEISRLREAPERCRQAAL